MEKIIKRFKRAIKIFRRLSYDGKRWWIETRPYCFKLILYDDRQYLKQPYLLKKIITTWELSKQYEILEDKVYRITYESNKETHYYLI